MKQKQLANKEIREINKEIKKQFNIENFFSKKDKVELQEEEEKIILKDSEAYFFYKDSMLIPTIRLLLKQNILKTATIDMPAVRFIAAGADIMRPGIKAMDDFKENSLVAVVDEENRKPLAVGIALFSSEAMKALSSGKAIKSIHHVGDRFWNS